MQVVLRIREMFTNRCLPLQRRHVVRAAMAVSADIASAMLHAMKPGEISGSKQIGILSQVLLKGDMSTLNTQLEALRTIRNVDSFGFKLPTSGEEVTASDMLGLQVSSHRRTYAKCHI